jgi:hypothetical protein
VQPYVHTPAGDFDEEQHITGEVFEPAARSLNRVFERELPGPSGAEAARTRTRSHQVHIKAARWTWLG